MSIRRRFAAVVVLFVFCSPRMGLAQSVEAPLPEVSDDDRHAVVISGGGAIGSYMAGNVFLLGRAIHRMDWVPKVYTGASAGAILSFLAVLDACAENPVDDPHESFYWRTFVPFGFRELTPGPDEPVVSVLSREALEPLVSDLEQAWNTNVAAGCAVRFGAPITRARPVSRRLFEGAPVVPQTVEPILVDIVQDEVKAPPGQRPPRVRQDIDLDLGAVVLPFGEGDDFELLRQVLYASSAYPFAFPPVPVDICPLDASDGEMGCGGTAVERRQFVDGGILDNQPLGLALRALRDPADPDGGGGLIYFLDPWDPTPVSEEDPALTAVGYLETLLGQVEAGRKSELRKALAAPGLAERLVVSERHLPPLSDTFSGFVDPTFREFDFYLGMWEASRVLENGTGDFSGAFGAFDQSLPDSESWTPYRCLRTLLTPETRGRVDDSDCVEWMKENRQFAVLLQVSADRLFDACQTETELDCALAALRVPGIDRLPPADRRKALGQGDLDYVLRLLADYRYAFEDLDLPGKRARQARRKLSYQVGGLVDRFARRQKPRLIGEAVGRVGVATLLGYHPPRHSAYLAVGPSLELAYGPTVASERLDWLRASLAVELDGLTTQFSDSPFVGVVPQAGLEIDLSNRYAAFLQVRTGVRALYYASSGDDFGSGDCAAGHGRSVPCSSFGGKVYVALGALGLLRVQLAGTVLPPRPGTDAWWWSLRPSLGLQIEAR